MPDRRRLLAAAFALAWAGAARGAGAQEASEDASPAYERIGRFIYAFHRLGVTRAGLDELALADLPPELAQRGRLLAQRYDAIVAEQASGPRDVIEAVLREAAQFGKAIRDARAGAPR